MYKRITVKISKCTNFCIIIGLRAFLCLVMGSEFLTPDCIMVRFTSRESDPPLSFHTCPKIIYMSTLIENTGDLKTEL